MHKPLLTVLASFCALIVLDLVLLAAGVATIAPLVLLPVVFCGWRRGPGVGLAAAAVGPLVNYLLLSSHGMWEQAAVANPRGATIGYLLLALTGAGSGVVANNHRLTRRLIRLKNAAGDLLLIAHADDGTIVDANTGATARLRDRADVGNSVTSLFPNMDLARLIARAEQEALFEVELETLDGPMPVAAKPSLVTDQGERFIVIAMRDRTEEHQLRLEVDAADERRRAAEQEAAMVRDNRLAQLGTMAASTAHEIANPLTFLIANVDHLEADVMPVLRRQDSDAQARAAAVQTLDEIIEDYRLGCERILEVSRDLKLFSRKEEEEVVLIEVEQLLDEAVRLARHHFPMGVALTSESAPHLVVEADMAKLSQVIINLLTNAAYAVQTTEAPAVALRASRDRGSVVIEVEDNGCGMPDDVLKRIFRPFFTTKPRGQGTGLGLSVCKDIVETASGSLAARSEVGQGTSFSIRLPSAEPHERRAAKTEIALVAPSTRRTLLIVEDEPLLRRSLSRTLERYFDVRTAPDGEAALEQLDQMPADVILSDLEMGRMNGPALYRELERRGHTATTTTLFMTGGAVSSEAAMFAHTHADRVLYKPLDIAAFLALLHDPSPQRTDEGPCENLGRCPLFPKMRDHPLLRVYQRTYCEAKDGAHEQCARMRALRQGHRPPLSLLPDGGELPLA